MKPLIKFVVLAAAALAVSYLAAFYHPVISFKYEDRFDGAGKAVVRRVSREAQLRPPTREESIVRLYWFAAADTLLLLIAFGWFRLHRRSKVVPEGGTLTIDGEPIRGELVLPLLALEDRRTPSLLGDLLERSREAEV
jgi:hypothetical protein